jgi:hypothetical protein
VVRRRQNVPRRNVPRRKWRKGASARVISTNHSADNLGCVAKLWQNEEALRSNTHAGECLQVVLC